jgi:predicted dehydrogenase
MKITSSTRRNFIKHVSAGVAAFTIVPRHVLGGPRYVAPSDRVNIAMIGAGRQAYSNLDALLLEDDAQIVAVADPARSCVYSRGYGGGKAAGREPMGKKIEEHYQQNVPGFRCALHEDFRLLIENERSIDAVVCSTPDHLHAYISAMAMRAGKHIYCEKPLTHNLAEARFIEKLARESGVATQMGNRGVSTPGIRQTVELVRSGVIGAIREVHTFIRSSRWNKALTGRPQESLETPSDLNWNLWVGPRTMRPYHPCYAPASWRDFWDFGNGPLGDFGCHDMNAALWAFDLPVPSEVKAHAAGAFNEEITPHGCMVYYRYPAKGEQPPLNLTWYDGGLAPRKPEAMGAFPLPTRGTLYIGEKGVICTESGGSPPRLFPDALRASYQKPASTLALSKGHFRDWLDACKGGPAPSGNFTYSARLTEMVLLGVLALRTGKAIEWDAATMTARSVPEAATMVRGTYRPGWELV